MKKSILIVDDNVDLADGLMLVLEDDYDAEVTYSAEEALEKLKGKHYDWVLSDVKMPGMNGVELKRIIAEEDNTTRVMLMSGFRVEQLVEEVTDLSPAMVKRELVSTSELDELLGDSLAKGVLILDKAKAPPMEEIQQHLVENGWAIQRLTEAGVESLGNGSEKTVQIIDQSPTIVDALVICLREKITNQPPIIIFSDTSAQSFSDEDPFKSHQIAGCLFKPFYFDKVFELLED